MTCQPLRSPISTKKATSNSSDSISSQSPPLGASSSCLDSDSQPEIYGDGDFGAEIVDEEPRCAACSSFGNGIGIVSNDHDAQTSYVSTQVPMNERVYQIVKQTCIRSLSVEISSPLFMEPNCSDNSKVIKNEDFDKEGAVLYGDQENGYTLSYTFKLRDAKARGFHRSYSLVVVSMDHYMLLNNYDFFLNGFAAVITRLQNQAVEVFAMEQDPGGDVAMATAVNRIGLMPTTFFPKKFSLDTSRSLTTIVNNNEIYHVLHRQMLFLLRTQTALLRDTVLEGVPTQDMLVSMERDYHPLDETDVITSFSSQQTICHIQTLKYLSRRLADMNMNFLMSLIWCLVVGDQLIVKSDDHLARKLFLFAFAHLLPMGCVKITSNSNVYVDYYKSNFVGCKLETVIPPDEFSSAYVVSLKTEPRTEILENMGFEIIVENMPKKSTKKPKIVDRYFKALTDLDINEQVLLSIISSTRSEWLNHAKLVFQLSRQREKINLDNVLSIVGCSECDSPVLKFFQAGLSQRYKQAVLTTITSSTR
ncbi:unnamed protein product [Bursaphelenchus xylophilus]|uniref:Folliculin n=1 Tax=Bursaphelenchus xylophilus TaxID=6326 RepID=A0A1I7SVS9_BURXY|nr:unnamed protein product [Bursaphelenchus xylophilus]CAG9098213.1 unnamed protein product [Bursaphelenchus xylophilus]